MVEGHKNLNEDLWLLQKHAVANNFGQALAMSAGCGKLCLPPTRFVATPSPDNRSIAHQHSLAQAVFTHEDTLAPGWIPKILASILLDNTLNT